jgi:hypothetical protein
VEVVKGKKIFWLAFALALLLVFSSVEARIILAKHEVNVVVDEEGYGAFNERYHLVINRFELADFLKDVEENGKNIMDWRIDYDFVFPRFGSTSDLKTINFTFDEENSILEIDYTWRHPFAVKEREEARTIKWNIPASVFSNFLQGSTIVIGPNQSIRLELPSKAKINQDEVSKEIVVQGNLLLLQEFTGSNLNIYYSSDKPIAPSFDTEALLKNALQNPLNQVVIIILVVLLVVLYLNRKPVIRRIEDYLLEHSDFGKPEEETELE